jgi:hypothetical protein
MANVYYSDKLGTNLNVFEKKTKGGEPFYYIYLNKNLITDADVEKLVKIIENSIPNKPKVKQKKGKLAYQITWSFSQPTPLATQQILFDVMFSWLKGYGYVDAYQPKGTKSSKPTSTLPQQPTTTSSTTINLDFNDIFWNKDYTHHILRVMNVEPKNDFFVAESYNSTSSKFTSTTYPLKNTIEYIEKGDFIRKKLQVGDVFETRMGNVNMVITDIQTISRGIGVYNNITYESQGVSVDGTELDFIEEVQKMEMKWVRTNMVGSNNTTPLQVGDNFVWCDIPFKPTKEEVSDYRSVTSVNLQVGELNYTNKDGTLDGTIDFTFIRQKIDNGELIIINLFDSLQYYDLFSRVGDGKLYRVVSIGGMVATNNTFSNIPPFFLVDLESYDSIAKDFVLQHIQFVDLKKNIENNELKYLGQVRDGDSFIEHDNNLERFVIKVDNYNDVKFDINDLNHTPPLNIGGDHIVMNVFTRSLLKQGFKFNLRLGNETTTQTPTPQVATNVAPKPQISNVEIDALKKELGDLIFLKSGISDLDFEDKINISTEIFETQRKIDGLTEKLFEQRVGDENFFDRLFEQSFTPLKSRYDMVIQKNDLPEILSPSGEMSDLDENMQILINSNDFKEWFGDWRNAFFYRNLPDFGGLNVSKVLNDKFEPQLVWHGTNNEFSYFDFEMFPANYFAVNREYSEFFAINKGGKGYVLPFFLDIKNPLDLSYFENDYVSVKDFFDWMYLMTGMSAEELDVNPLFLDPTMQPQPIWMYIRNNPTMLQKIAQGKVYDGIKFYEFNPNEKDNPDKKAYETLAYIIFDPHQAKLADPSRGDILLASLKSFMLKRGGKI